MSSLEIKSVRSFTPITLDEATTMLGHIPSEEYDLWFRILSSLKSEFGDAAYIAADNWSQKSLNYDPFSFKSTWQSIDAKGGITIATLTYHARQYGWANSKGIPYVTDRVKSNLTGPLVEHAKNGTKAYALRLWLAANTNDEMVADHRYAIGKGIDWAAGAGRGTASGKIIGRFSDCIIVPIHNIESNRIQAVQCINVDGSKQTFGPLSGGGLILGNTLDSSLTWYVCEGWASAVSIVFHHQNGNGVCAASFGKSNQQKLAALIDKAHKPKKIRVLEEVD